MLRYKTETRPGLVALYDIRPGNGAGQFLQPRSPHGAKFITITCGKTTYRMAPTTAPMLILNTELCLPFYYNDEAC